MQANFVSHYSRQGQDKLCMGLKNFAKAHTTIGHLVAIPVVLLDSTIELAKFPLTLLESIALAALNLMGSAFLEHCSIRAAKSNLINAGFISLIAIPYAILLSIVTIQNLFTATINPTHMQSSRRLTI